MKTMNEYGLTEMQMRFSKVLKALNLTKDGTITIALLLQEDEQILEMVTYINNNVEATESELLRKAVEIHEATSNAQ